MTLLRNLVVALLLLLTGVMTAHAQTASEYDAVLSASTDGGDSESQERGLYDDLNPEDYERVGHDLDMLSATQFNLDRFRSGLIKTISTAPEMVSELSTELDKQSPTGSAIYFLGIAAWVLLFWVVAQFLEHQIYGKRIVGPWFISMQVDHPDGIVEKLPVLVIRAFIGLTGIILSAVTVGLAANAFLNISDPATEKTVIAFIITIAITRSSTIIWRMVISPYLPNYRLPHLSDPCAKKLFRWLRVTVAASLAVIGFYYWIEGLGVWKQGEPLLIMTSASVIVVLNIALVLANRTSISQAFLGATPEQRARASWMARVASSLWAPFAIIYLLFAWVVQVYKLMMGVGSGTPLILGAYAILLGMIVVYGVVAYSIARIFQRRREIVESRAIGRQLDAAEDSTQSLPRIVSAHPLERELISGDGGDDGDDTGGPSSNAYLNELKGSAASRLDGLHDFEGLARRIASIVSIGAGAYALAYIWNLTYLFQEGGPLENLGDVAAIILIGYICYESLRIWIDNKIEEEIGDVPELEPGDEGGGHSAASRLATLLPLFRNFLLFTVAVTFLMLVLMEMGIEVAPIFAGAGIVGLAIGFGAQTLVRDILSGAFFLIDDAFRRGEYIDVGTVKGTVEKISIRSFQLRHHLGALNTIPFGEIHYLTNFSRDWVMMKLPLRLTYDTDIEKVRKLIKKLGEELLNHPEEGHKFLQPLKSQGVYKMEDSAMIARVKFMTRPGDQWTTRKLVYTRIRELFEANDIKFAHREVTVRLGDRDPNSLTEEEREAISAAALTAVEAAERSTHKAVGDDR